MSLQVEPRRALRMRLAGLVRMVTQLALEIEEASFQIDLEAELVDGFHLLRRQVRYARHSAEKE